MKNTEQGMGIDPDAFQRDLEAVAEFNGVPFGRVECYWQAESEHVHEMRSQNSGTLLLFRALQSLFLETVELFNAFSTCGSGGPELTFYTRFVPRLVHTFQQLCASELAATHGYPMPAYTILRNTFDHLILISAAMQSLTDFFKIEGSDPHLRLSLNEARKLRVATERDVRKKMTGKESGLSENTITKLRLWDALFDFEVHGAKLSFATAIGWVQGNAPLHVYPKYQVDAVSMYSNRLCEVAWMAHRLLPLLQHSALRFPPDWGANWRMVDGRFEDQVRHFAGQQHEKVGLAIIELVSAKFPFSGNSLYPLEGLGMSAVGMDKPNSRMPETPDNSGASTT